MKIDRLVSIDAESNGLAGRAFCVALTLSDPTGELDHAVYRCPEGDELDPWVEENVLPGLADVEVNCVDYAGLLLNLGEKFFDWTEEGTPVAAHVAWPVEARLLLDVFPGERVWQGPYPLYDVSSVLLAKGFDPLSVDDYLLAHGIEAPAGSPHHPLYDARAAERCLRHLLKEDR